MNVIDCHTMRNIAHFRREDIVCSNEQIPFLFVQMNKHFEIKTREIIEKRKISLKLNLERLFFTQILYVRNIIFCGIYNHFL
jgi:hypothetical protein